MEIGNTSEISTKFPGFQPIHSRIGRVITNNEKEVSEDALVQMTEHSDDGDEPKPMEQVDILTDFT